MVVKPYDGNHGRGVSLNLMTQGVDPELDFSRINEVRRDVEFCNRMPIGDMDPISLKIQAMVPLPNVAGATLINNGLFPFTGSSITTIPALKLDHSLSSRAKFSVYWSTTGSERAVGIGGNQGDGGAVGGRLAGGGFTDPTAGACHQRGGSGQV